MTAIVISSISVQVDFRIQIAFSFGPGINSNSSWLGGLISELYLPTLNSKQIISKQLIYFFFGHVIFKKLKLME